MCPGCVSTAEALMITGGGAIGASRAGFARLLVRTRRGNGTDRRVRSHEQSAAFLRALGHDPEILLGPPPAVGLEPEPQHV